MGAFLLPLQARKLHHLLWRDALLDEMLAFGLERPRGANADAVTAEDAGGFCERLIEEGSDLGIEAAAAEAEGIGELGIVGANLHAAPTHHTL